MSTQQGVTNSSPFSTLHPISVLLTNIRLLDLTKCDDWPKISAQVFIAKDDPENRKVRIQCVEWILYRLWQIWDQEDCHEVNNNDLYTLDES